MGSMATDKKTNIRIPPQSIDSEKAVLGSIMLRQGAIHEINDTITSDTFYVSKHSNVYKIMLELSSKGDQIFFLFLKN